jgi:serine/threonine-protein kinase
MASGSDNWWEDYVRAFIGADRADWVVRDKLGEGNSAAVFRVDTPTGVFALKIYRPEFFSGANEVAERHRLALHERLKGHRCGSLLQIIEIGDLKGSAYVLMEYVPWASMDTMLGAIPTEKIPKLMTDIATAAKWLHDNGLVHRDIKPANVLVSPNFDSAKLVDFGVIRESNPDTPDVTDHGTRRPFVATAQYSSPEYLFRLVEPSKDLWEGLSLYQIGAILHDLLTGR